MARGQVAGVRAQLRYMAGEKQGWTGAERAALGAQRPGGRAPLHWFDLPNRHPEPEHTFAVDGETVHAVLQECRRRGIQPYVLWHCHRAQVGPSRMDIAHLPHWLTLGVVYDVETGTSTSYNRDGVISSTSGSGAHVSNGVVHAS